jgi:hypothetical protein
MLTVEIHVSDNVEADARLRKREKERKESTERECEKETRRENGWMRFKKG